jgi:multidrug efflux pump subunit AcrB
VGIARLYRKPVAIATGLLIVLILSGTILSRARLGPSGEESGAAFSVIVEHFGVDAPEIERTITRPLEDALGTLPGLKSLRSLSDYGSSRVTVFMRPGAPARETYLQLRDSVDRIYGQLPGSVQRPRILSSGEEGRPVFIASVRSPSMTVTDLATLLEKELKPALETIEGAGEVEVGGGAPREIHVVLDEERASRAGLDAAQVARAIQSNELLAPLGHVRADGSELAVVLSGRLGSLEALRALRVSPTATAPTLGAVARVEVAPRERDEISRVDGAENAVVAVKSSGGANLIELSRAIRAESALWEKRGLQFGVILDTGAELEKSLASILEAILFAIVVSAITLPLFVSGARRVIALSLSIPVIGCASAAAICAAGFSLDTYILSGLAIGIGTMIDTGIIIAGRAQPGIERELYFAEAERIVPALLSSALTALIVLVPLIALDFGGGGIRRVSLALAALMGIAFVLSCLFIPPYAVARRPRQAATPRAPLLKGPAGTAVANARSLARTVAERIVTACATRIVGPLAGGAALAAIGIWAVASIGIDLEPPPQTDSIPVHLECETGASIESVDGRAASFAARLRSMRGITVVQSTARRGSAEMEVGFNPALTSREKLAAAIRDEGRSVPGGFAYLPEGAGAVERSLEIAITGDDDATLKGYAGRAAQLLGQQSMVREVVLNFKEPADSYVFKIDPGRAAAVGASAEAVTGTLRWHLYGPVALKWIGEERETDLRVMGIRARAPSLRQLAMVPVPLGNGRSVPVAATGGFTTVREGGKLYRLNRQRAVYLTAHVQAGDIRRIVRNIERTLGTLTVAPGYAFDVGRDLVEQAERFQTLWLTFGLCILLIYLVLGVLTESFLWPLVILAVLPASITLPLIIMRLSGERLVVPVLIGLIVLSGMAVNNSILIVDAYRSRRGRGSEAVTKAVLSRLSALTATSAVTVLGHLPLLFAAGEGAAFMRSLAFVIIWGIVGSYLATILLVPALIGLAAQGLRLRRRPVRGET